MELYIFNALVDGIMRPSPSPAGTVFIFVEKKYKSFQPCIDYRGLKDIMLRNRYPLPLLTFAFELLEGATVFSKLDLQSLGSHS